MVLTSSYFQTGGRSPRPVLIGYGWHKIRSRVLFVHHAAWMLGKPFPKEIQ